MKGSFHSAFVAAFLFTIQSLLAAEPDPVTFVDIGGSAGVAQRGSGNAAGFFSLESALR